MTSDKLPEQPKGNGVQYYKKKGADLPALLTLR